MLLILNDPPYGTERSYNGLRLAGSLSRTDDAEVRVFLMGDAVGCAAADQKVPEGYYHLDRMIESAPCFSRLRPADAGLVYPPSIG